MAKSFISIFLFFFALSAHSQDYVWMKYGYTKECFRANQDGDAVGSHLSVNKCLDYFETPEMYVWMKYGYTKECFRANQDGDAVGSHLSVNKCLDYFETPEMYVWMKYGYTKECFRANKDRDAVGSFLSPNICTNNPDKVKAINTWYDFWN